MKPNEAGRPTAAAGRGWHPVFAQSAVAPKSGPSRLVVFRPESSSRGSELSFSGLIWHRILNIITSFTFKVLTQISVFGTKDPLMTSGAQQVEVVPEKFELSV